MEKEKFHEKYKYLVTHDPIDNILYQIGGVINRYLNMKTELYQTSVDRDYYKEKCSNLTEEIIQNSNEHNYDILKSILSVKSKEILKKGYKMREIYPRQECIPTFGETPPYPDMDDYCSMITINGGCEKCQIPFEEMPEDCQKEILKEYNISENEINKLEGLWFLDIQDYVDNKRKLNNMKKKILKNLLKKVVTIYH